MDINFPRYNIGINDGFGTAGLQVLKSLERLGHEVVNVNPYTRPEVDVTFSFSHPDGFYNTDGFDVGYFPWESDAMQNGWKKRMSVMDELWVTSPWLQEVAADWGFDTYVYEHGVNPIFTQPRKYPADRPLTFLAMGLESYRKGSYEVLRAFNRAFGGSDQVRLIIKTQARNMPKNFWPNVEIIDWDMTLEELAHLYYSVDVFVAPTYGEGFGIPARDALCTGIPVIATGGFLPYEKFMHPDLVIPATKIDSPWPDIHPGQVFRPDVDSLVDQMRAVEENYSGYFKHSLSKQADLGCHYNWDRLTDEAFSALENRLR